MKVRSFSTFFLCLPGFLLMAGLVGCGSSDGGGTALAQPGTVSVSLTDAPACGYEAVVVSVSKIRIHQSDSANENAAGWREIRLDPPRAINLLNLNDPTQPNFALDYLGETPLAAGHYTQLRLVLEGNRGTNPLNWSNYIILEGQDPTDPGNRIRLDTPSGIQTGIKLIHQFTVQSGQRVDLLLDFDACHSIVETGNGSYKLKPVIKVIPYVLNGIDGFIDSALFDDQSTGNNNVNNVVVTTQRNGEVVRATVPNSSATPHHNRGKFFLARLAPGNYDVVITADNHATAVILGVPVPTDTSITRISESTAPFQLTNSLVQSVNGTVVLNPADDEGAVVVRAQQTLNPGPTVTVKSVVATLLDAAVPTGDYGYNLPLPTAAPSSGPYATPLPIVFTPQPASVAGWYTVQGSAKTDTKSYATQTPLPSAKDISVGANQTQDFTLSSP